MSVSIFPTSDAEKDAADGSPSVLIDVPHESEHVSRGNCIEDLRVPVQDVVQANSADEEEPNGDDRCEQEPNPMAPVVLQGEEQYLNRTSRRNRHVWRQSIH